MRIGGSALQPQLTVFCDPRDGTVGEYLSPRLYVSYGVGLFERDEVIGLHYRLFENTGVRVQRGPEEARTGIECRIEK